VLRSALAILLAFVAAELAARAGLGTRGPDQRLEIRAGQPDQRFGWLWTPKTTEVPVNGRTVRYAIDAHSDRAPSQDFVEDPGAPTLILTGESIAFGHGLDWEQALPGVLHRRLGVQVIDVAVSGYGTRQAALRLADARPRFRNVVVTVAVFLPVQIGRNLKGFRQRSALRLVDVFGDMVPILTDARLDDALRATRADLQQADLVVFVDLTAKPGDGDWLEERMLRDLNFVRIRVPRETLVNDGHPHAQETEEIASLIVEALRRGRKQ
jgi:hypothetical protein